MTNYSWLANKASQQDALLVRVRNLIRGLRKEQSRIAPQINQNHPLYSYYMGVEDVVRKLERAIGRPEDKRIIWTEKIP